MSNSVRSPALLSLPQSVTECALAPLFTTTDLIALSAASRATRELVLTLSLWRHHVFTRVPPIGRSVTGVPSWCDVVQLLDTRRYQKYAGKPAACILSVASLVSLPSLRRLSSTHFASSHLSRVSTSVEANPPARAAPSLSSMRYLTRIALCSTGTLDIGELRLLSTLPALVSFEAQFAQFEESSEETLTELLALTLKQQNTPRKPLTDDANVSKVDEGGVRAATEVDGDEDIVEEEERCSPLLLFLYALAAKPSFVHLNLDSCNLSPFVMEHMPVWPHLQCLSVRWNDQLNMYLFHNMALHFPSLTSLATSSRTDAAIEQFVQLPMLEELRLNNWLANDESEEERVRTTTAVLRALSTAPLLRSVQYRPPKNYNKLPDLAALSAHFTLSGLVRLTIPCFWLTRHRDKCVQLLTQHRFEHLRCLELLTIHGNYSYIGPQTDFSLLPFVKPADFTVADRGQRQAVRAHKRRSEEPHSEEVNYDGDDVVGYDIPPDNAANFPVLECLALPYAYYNKDQIISGQVSGWMKQQLRRSYEYEVASEWEADEVTLGEAELLKSIA